MAASAPHLLIDFILSIIRNESGGKPGIKANRATKFSKELPTRSGGVVKVNKALGLMQTIPLVVDDYNKTHKTAFYDDMTGATVAAAKKQIQVGVWTFNNNVRAIQAATGKQLIKSGKINIDLLKLVLVAYAWGVGRTKRKLNELKKAGKAPTFENLQAAWPQLGQPANRPIYYANKIVNRVLKPPKGSKGPKRPGQVPGRGNQGNRGSDLSMIVLGGILFFYLMKGI